MAQAPSHLLVVDDNADNRRVLTRRLERQGYTVTAVDSGAEALSVLSQHHCDLVLLDVMMRDIDGFEALKRIRQRYSMLQVPVIMITALSESQNAVEALQLGANDYITKPIDFLVTLARIRTHLVLKRLSEHNDDFVQVASHDVKRSLTQIQEMAEELIIGLKEVDLPAAEGLQEQAALIGHTAERTQSRVDSFLAANMPEAGQLREQANLNDIARAVVSRNLVHARRKGISLDISLDDSPLAVRMFQARLEQVVENLVDNAIKFSPSGTTTSVRTWSDGGWAVVEVSDQGPGIREGDLDKVFERYAHPANQPTGGEEGAGIGLSVCKELVEEYRGEMGVRNNESAGATFWCRLPVS